MKKQPKTINGHYSTLKWVAGGIISVGIILGAFTKISVYIGLPEVQEALAQQQDQTEKKVYNIEKYIEVQQRANELNQQWQREQRQREQKRRERPHEDREDYYYRYDEGAI